MAARKKNNRIPAIPFKFEDAVSRLLKVKPQTRPFSKQKGHAQKPRKGHNM
jgi:hypothetical protein